MGCIRYVYARISEHGHARVCSGISLPAKGPRWHFGSPLLTAQLDPLSAPSLMDGSSKASFFISLAEDQNSSILS